MQKTCKRCGIEFEAERKDDVYCHNPCTHKPNPIQTFLTKKPPPKPKNMWGKK